MGALLLITHAAAAQQPWRAPSAAPDPGFTLDFEEGDLRGWDPQGEAFATQPTLGDNPTARGRGQPSNHQGRYWIGTFEDYQGRPGQRPGAIQGDEPTGSLTSPTFTCPGGTLSFLVGGGAGFETRVELRVLGGIEPGARVRRASGRNDETMRRVWWDLDDLRGRQCFIRIVDASSEGWGHINVDDFRFSAVERNVPGLIGLPLPEARQVLAEYGLRAGTVREVETDEGVATVVRQAPQPGTPVEADSAVDLWLAVPTASIEVPNVVGQPDDMAERTLFEAGVRPGARENEPSVEPAGTVVWQAPPPGRRVARGTAVELGVATGPAVVPNLIGRAPAEARELLGAAGLRIGAVNEAPADAAPGLILRQQPEPGAAVPPRSAVSLWLAAERPAGPATPPAGVVVPDLSGMSVETARRTLRRYGLRLGTRRTRRSALSAPGSVVAQSPPPGVQVPPLARVDVVTAGWMFWLSAGSGGLLVLAGATFIRLRRRGVRGSVVDMAGVTTVLHEDPGRTSVDTGGPPIELELRLQFVVDPGRQSLQTKGRTIRQESPE